MISGAGVTGTAATAWASAGEDGDDPVSPAAKLCGFLLLLAVIFIGAYAAGAHLGPGHRGLGVTPGPRARRPAARAGGRAVGGGSMNMGGP